MKQPDILIFMTDQHTPYCSGWYGNNVDTPNLDALVQEGTAFDEAYTACPLCVPSRVSMLSGKRPANTGIFTLTDALPDMTPTFLHYLVLQGYETVLVGRMHFVGFDQRHGFTKRIASDCTTITWNRQDMKDVRGVYESAYGGYQMTNIVGGGDNNASYYDQYVVDKALEYLSQDHDKPQCICVSVYSPHHPYVGPKHLYDKYLQKVQIPESYYDEVEPDVWKNKQKKEVTPALSKEILASYCAMVEETDGRIGAVRKAFEEFCKKRNTENMFVYISDHGDTAGDRNSYGKCTFYEKSVKIPLIFSGTHIQTNNRVHTPVSIMDLGPTILDYIHAKPMHDIDGVSLLPALQGKSLEHSPVYAEYLSGFQLDKYSFMVKENQYKYCCFNSEDTELLYDTVQDPQERNNIIHSNIEIADHMRALASKKRLDEQSIKLNREHMQNLELWKAYEQAVGPVYDLENRFQGPAPQSYREYPEELSENVTHIEKPDWKR